MCLKNLLPFSLFLLLSTAACQETPNPANVSSSPNELEPTEEAPSAEVSLALATDGITTINGTLAKKDSVEELK